MDWDTALRHLPRRVLVTDRKGRVLLQSADVAGVSVGHSFLKLAHADEVVIVGRAAKRCLADGQPVHLPRITGVDGMVHGLELTPFKADPRTAVEPDHLVVVVGPASDAHFRPTPPPTDRVSARTKTPDTAPQASPPTRRAAAPASDEPPTVAPTATPGPTARRAAKTTPLPAPSARSTPAPAPAAKAPPSSKVTPAPGPSARSTPAPAPPRPAARPAKVSGPPGPRAVPEAAELVVVAAGGGLPLARALEVVLKDRVRTRAMPVASFVEVLAKRANAEPTPAAIERAIDPTTRLWFLGESPYADATRVDAWRTEAAVNGGWALAGGDVRRASTWVGEITGARATDVVADLQFEIMEIMRRAMPIRRQGRVVEVPAGLKRAAAFLEQPAAMDVQGDTLTQARHHVLVVAIARFLQDGLDPLLDPQAP